MLGNETQHPMLQWLQHSYRMPPAAALAELPDTGISLTRWKRAEAGLSHLIENPNSSYMLSLILKPMRGRCWFGPRLVRSGSIGAHTFRLTPSGVEPRWQCDGGFDFLLLIIPDRTIERIAGADAPRIHEHLSRSLPVYLRDDVVSHIGLSMLRACDNPSQYARQFADGLGHALVAHVLGHYARPASTNVLSLSPSRLRRVTQHIADHLGEELRVEDLAKIAGLSESHFAHAFRASTGATPHRFVNSARIERARQLLADGDKPIAEIALDCGFKDPSHFARVFQAIVGLTPRSFRRSQ